MGASRQRKPRLQLPWRTFLRQRINAENVDRDIGHGTIIVNVFELQLKGPLGEVGFCAFGAEERLCFTGCNCETGLH